VERCGAGQAISAEATLREAEADPADAYVLDVPVPRERRTLPWSDQHLAGRLRVKLTRRGRVVYEGESALAGLEQGRAP